MYFRNFPFWFLVIISEGRGSWTQKNTELESTIQELSKKPEMKENGCQTIENHRF